MHSDDKPADRPDPQPEFITPDDTLLQKVSCSGRGLTQRAMLEAADAELEVLRPEYVEAMQGELLHLDALFRAWAPGDADPATAIEELHGTARDLGALGTTFGYDLITILAQSLDALLEQAPPDHPRLRTTIATHLDALRLVMARGITGDGGAPGRHLVEALAGLVAAIGTPVPPPAAAADRGKAAVPAEAAADSAP